MGIKENLTKIKEQIGNIKVKIIAVTKYASEQQISEAYNLGILDFGESYVQDAIKKISKRCSDENLTNLIRWHFIGRLQKNKVKHVVGNFCLIHSVDSIELAELISKTASKKELVQDILLQTNISCEATKAGFKSDELKSSFEKLIKLPHIKILGLMTIAPKTENKKIIRSCFSTLKDLREELNQEYNTNIKELSMGMSDDYPIALEEGSTILRIGRAIFKN